MLVFLKTRSFPKIPEEVRSLPKKSEAIRSLRTGINASSLPVLFTSKIRDREEGISFYSFFTWFSFLTWVRVNILLEIVSSKMGTTHIFQSGVRNWTAGVNRREIEVFNPQARDSRLRRESWQVYIHDTDASNNRFVFLYSRLSISRISTQDSKLSHARNHTFQVCQYGHDC